MEDEENLRAKSLRAFKEKHPEAVALRFSMSDYREQDWMRNVPLYAMANTKLWGASDTVGANALSAADAPFDKRRQNEHAVRTTRKAKAPLITCSP